MWVAHDDTRAPDCVSQLVAGLIAHPEAIIAGGGHHHRHFLPPGGRPEAQPLQGGAAPHPVSLKKLRLGGFPEPSSEPEPARIAIERDHPPAAIKGDFLHIPIGAAPPCNG